LKKIPKLASTIKRMLSHRLKISFNIVLYRKISLNYFFKTVSQKNEIR
jgi:hypothetical protein